MLIVTNPKTEHLTNPICVPSDRVRFSWMAESSARNEYQAAYRILVTKESDDELVWDSGKIRSDNMNGILYAGQTLEPRRKYFWQVKIWSQSGESSDFSELQSFETDLSAMEWDNAKWICADTAGLPLFRKSFTLTDKKIIHARVYASGLGVYELSLNGKKLDDSVLNPLVTRYHKRYFYNAFDITPLLNSGENVFGIMLGNGYYCMHDNKVDWQKTNWANAPWADKPKCKVLAYITYEDGTETLLSTDESWKYEEGPIRVDEAYYGEEYDARFEQDGWNKIGFDDSTWHTSCIASSPLGEAQIQLAEPCRVTQTLPLHLLYHYGNEYLYDTQKIIAGWVCIQVHGNAGDEVEISYSEWLDDKGKLSQKGLLGEWNFADRVRYGQTDYYILHGNGIETYAPHFTYKGFRYVRIRAKGNVTIENIVAEHVHTDLAVTGHFSCSDTFVNELHKACKNVLLNNLHSYPSDTPVYENMGYLADGYLTQEMAQYNFDATNFYEKWARDIHDQAKDNGYIEQTAPMWDEDKENAPEWSFAIAIVPYQIYRATGDKTVLIENYDKSKRIFAYQMELTQNGIANSMWGDHVSAKGNMLKNISPTVCLFRAACILAETAMLQGLNDEKDNYRKQADYIKQAFNNRFYDVSKGYYHEEDTTELVLGAQILPLAFGLADETQTKNIEDNIKKYANELDGGIFTIKYLFPILTKMGLESRLYKWITEKKAPSWGYWLSFGDCSLWEQWYDFSRTRSHHMFGTVDEWLYKSLAGLDVIDAKTLRIKPFICEELEWAKAHTNMPGGRASCYWRKENEELIIKVEIPFNTTATVYIPKMSGKTFYNSNEHIKLGSGNYEFRISQ